MTDQVAIDTARLTKHYGDFPALVDLDLDVRTGEIFGFLGPNGAGKTTMIRTILDEIRPTSGSATILGMDSHEQCVEIRNHINIGKYATRLALQWKDRLSFVLHEDMSIKRLRFEDIIKDARDDMVADDAATRFDLDFSLMTLELAEFLPQLFTMLGGEESSQEAHDGA